MVSPNIIDVEVSPLILTLNIRYTINIHFFSAISHDFQHGTEQARQLIKCLPPEMLLNIFSYLNPKDLCHTAQVCKQWSECAMNGDLWSVLHPARWARGDWNFGIGASSDDCNCDCQPNYDLLTFSE